MEKFISDLKKTAKNAAQKTGEIVEIGKLKLAIQDTKGKINDLYKELGESLYAARKDGNDDADSIEKIIEEIDAMYEKLASQEEELATLKKQKKCPSCGVLCDDEADFCSKCGAEL